MIIFWLLILADLGIFGIAIALLIDPDAHAGEFAVGVVLFALACGLLGLAMNFSTPY